MARQREEYPLPRSIFRPQFLQIGRPGPSRAEAGRRVAVRSANCSCPRRVAKTSAPQSTPFARQVAASSAPLLRMRVLWTGYLSARHDFWPRPLSVDTHPTVTTCKANNWKDASVPQIGSVQNLSHFRLAERRPAVEHDRRPGRCGKPRPVALPRPAGRGASCAAEIFRSYLSLELLKSQ